MGFAKRRAERLATNTITREDALHLCALCLKAPTTTRFDSLDTTIGTEKVRIGLTVKLCAPCSAPSERLAGLVAWQQERAQALMQAQVGLVDGASLGRLNPLDWPGRVEPT